MYRAILSEVIKYHGRPPDVFPAPALSPGSIAVPIVCDPTTPLPMYVGERRNA